MGAKRSDGSSPLTRGKLRDRRRRRRHARLIPAHAGKTLPPRPRLAALRAHPRSRGENHRRSAPNGIKNGSSPLTRGKRRRAGGRASGSGLIPAHAGKTPVLVVREIEAGAHPRSRGENIPLVYTVLMMKGSSPLTRGKQGDRSGLQRRVGLIPAHAGKTDTGGVSTYGHGAHPRSRGENTYAGEDRNLALGSSPLTRGKLHVLQAEGHALGLIPAHAGKTRAASPCPTFHPAHPRSRGENHGLPPPGWPVTGSSPLTRGKQVDAGRPAGH